jgi:hypothetical protein
MGMEVQPMLTEDRPVMSVPAAGRHFFGIGEAASYAAAKAGEIPRIRIGKRIFASVPAIEKMLLEAGKARDPEAA